jgi:hypothetical protein
LADSALQPLGYGLAGETAPAMLATYGLHTLFRWPVFQDLRSTEEFTSREVLRSRAALA